jgi:hypothetical protein
MPVIVKHSILFIIMLSMVFIILYGEKYEGSKGKNDGEKKTAEMIIAMERSALDRWGKGDPWGFVENTATEITYFDPDLERRLDGLTDFRRLLASIEGKIKIDRLKIINPKVQIHGDTAVLTFNLVDVISTPEGSTKESRWNSTEVFSRLNGKWQRIHSHWSLTKPKVIE